MTAEGLIAVPDALGDVAGIIVWWELTGFVGYDDLAEAAELHGVAEAELPELPGCSTALMRAAAASTIDKRQLLRPLKKRGSWEIVQETVVERGLDNEEGKPTTRERTSHESLVVGWVDRDLNGQLLPYVEAQNDAGDVIARRILACYPGFKHALSTSDVSAWLIYLAEKRCSGVGLRARGGFYFIPRDCVDYWRAVVTTVRACSGHQLMEIPAMRTEEAVEAILGAVRKEAELAFSELETYLEAGVISTRGANAYTRQMQDVRAKVQRYADLLGVAQVDLLDRAEQLAGVLQSAHLAAQEP